MMCKNLGRVPHNGAKFLMKKGFFHFLKPKISRDIFRISKKYICYFFDVNKAKSFVWGREIEDKGLACWLFHDKNGPMYFLPVNKHDNCYGKMFLLEITQSDFNPHKILLRGCRSTGVFSSFRYSYMLYFSYKIGPCFVFFM